MSHWESWKNLFACRLCWQIAVTVFLLIPAIESVILAPMAMNPTRSADGTRLDLSWPTDLVAHLGADRFAMARCNGAFDAGRTAEFAERLLAGGDMPMQGRSKFCVRLLHGLDARRFKLAHAAIRQGHQGRAARLA